MRHGDVGGGEGKERGGFWGPRYKLTANINYSNSAEAI